jgi:hypothetical protein
MIQQTFSIIPNALSNNTFNLTGDFISNPNIDGRCKLIKTATKSFKIKEGDLLSYKQSYYRAGTIHQIKRDKPLWSIQNYATTKIHPFALSMLGYGWNANILSNRNFIATVYLGHHDNIPVEDRRFLLLYRIPTEHSKVKTFKSFEAVLKTHPNLVGEYYPDDYYVMYVFDVPAEHQIAYDFMIDGRWSEFPNEFKQQVIRFNSYLNNPTGKCFQILYKTENLREKMSLRLGTQISKNAELYEKPNYETEVYFDTMKMKQDITRYTLDLEDIFGLENNNKKKE